jgi:hypothetical protein
VFRSFTGSIVPPILHTPVYVRAALHNGRIPGTFRKSSAFSELGGNSDRKVKVKVKQVIAGLDRPIVFQEVEAPRFHDNRHMRVVRF